MASHGVSRLDPEGSRLKRARNLEYSTKLLREIGFILEQKSETHFVVKLGFVVADFWPTTGQYGVRKKGAPTVYKRGVKNLMRDMRSVLYWKNLN